MGVKSLQNSPIARNCKTVIKSSSPPTQTENVSVITGVDRKSFRKIVQIIGSGKCRGVMKVIQKDSSSTHACE